MGRGSETHKLEQVLSCDNSDKLAVGGAHYGKHSKVHMSEDGQDFLKFVGRLDYVGCLNHIRGQVDNFVEILVANAS